MAEEHHCTHCCKPYSEVEAMFLSPLALICSLCVEQYAIMLKEFKLKPKPPKSNILQFKPRNQNDQ